VLPEALTAGEFELEGQVLRAVSVGQGDTEFSTVLHVPSAAAVVGGDVVYNGVHMMTAETDQNSREAWIASLDAVAALNPQIVVAGHKSVGAPDLPESISASQQYLSEAVPGTCWLNRSASGAAPTERTSFCSASGRSPASIVFAHGLWADGSCFNKLIPTLQAEGHEVFVEDRAELVHRRQ
jgi:hypothetical protein